MNPKPKGILFRGEMIRSLLNTQIDSWPAKPVDESKPWKWQTRRELKNQPGKFVHVDYDDRQGWHLWWDVGDCGSPDVTQESVPLPCPHPVGSIIYAKETHIPKASGVIYKADFDSVEAAGLSGMYGGWKPSIFMKTIYARLWFRVMNVRVERVNKISGDDARAEGTHGHDNQADSNVIGRYRELWDSINGNGDFDKGQCVWVYEIARITKPV